MYLQNQAIYIPLIPSTMNCVLYEGANILWVDSIVFTELKLYVHMPIMCTNEMRSFDHNELHLYSSCEELFCICVSTTHVCCSEYVCVCACVLVCVCVCVWVCVCDVNNY